MVPALLSSRSRLRLPAVFDCVVTVATPAVTWPEPLNELPPIAPEEAKTQPVDELGLSRAPQSNAALVLYGALACSVVTPLSKGCLAPVWSVESKTAAVAEPFVFVL